ncbi:DNA replication and repair protein RecF [uncultured archaeon]|nr:DNA replication and repair protein RecF [uncultured archaeon]
MVNASLKKVFIKNFKSLHDCEIDIGKMNVVVGANASGKSNLVEAFRLLKKIYVEKDPFPFLEWWGYDNVVWQRKEELPITIGLHFDIEGYDVYFETNFTGVGRKFQILREVLDIRGYLKFMKEGDLLTIGHNPDFIERVIKNLPKYETSLGDKTKLKKNKSGLMKEKKYSVDLEQKLLEYGFGILSASSVFTDKKAAKEFILSNFTLSEMGIGKSDEKVIILCPAIFYEEEFEDGSFWLPDPIINIAVHSILEFIGKLSILYPLNIRSMKNPQPFRREETIKEDGTNIASVYHTIYLKEGKIPEQIYNIFTLVFPKIDVRPHITDDGRVMLKFFEDGLELLPPNTSDGFYKILTLLTAIYLKSPLLIIDEIENSLHPETLELILDTIKASDIQAIITTHSPVVVDMTEPDNMILVEKEHGESRFKRIKDPEKIRGFLKEKGIKFSVGWLYGELSHIE